MPIDYPHHSPSGLNLFAASPAMFVLERILGHKQPGSAAMYRGVAVENAVSYALMHPDADEKQAFKVAHVAYDTLAAMSGDARREKYRENIPDMVTQALDELRPYGPPSEMQGVVNWRADGLKYPFLGFFDYYWKNHGLIVDLKTTEKMPGQIKIPHARQVSLYAGDNHRAMLTYVTPKKCVTYGLENIREHRAALVSLAKKVENFLAQSDDPEFFVSITAPDVESFYWTSPEARELAFRYWKI